MPSENSHFDEIKRLSALKSYSILDTLPEKQYDDITKLASQICETPVSQITLVDEHRQWYKSNFGVDIAEVDREIGFCTHTVSQEEAVLMVNDLRQDERFMNNPFVSGDPHAKFYAGVSLTDPQGYNIGALCVIDVVPRTLTESQIESLKSLSSIAMHLLELHKAEKTLGNYTEDLRKRNDELKQFASVAAHDIKSPLVNILSATDLLEKKFGDQMNEKASLLISMINKSSNDLNTMINGILEISKNGRETLDSRELIAMDDFIVEVFELMDKSKKVNYQFPSGKVVYVNKTGLQQIFMNLISNAIKHSDQEQVVIDFTFKNLKDEYQFSISDDGPGIPSADKSRIFNLFERGELVQQDGNGIGLSTVKRLVEAMSGTISVDSSQGKGATFKFTISK